MQKHVTRHGQRRVDLFRESRKAVRKVTHSHQGPVLEKGLDKNITNGLITVVIMTNCNNWCTAQWWMDFIFVRLPSACKYVLSLMK